MFSQYASGYNDIWGFTDLLANNFGLLYNSILYEVLMLTGDPPAINPNYFMIGYELGNIFYLVFFSAVAIFTA